MKNFHEDEITKRIKLLRSRYAGSRGKSKFARALGISPSTYDYYEKDRVPPIEVMLKISEITGADLRWLLTGQKSHKTPSFGPSRAIADLGAEPTLGPNISLLRKLEDLLDENPDLINPISAFIELLHQKQGFEKDFGSDAAKVTAETSKIPPAKQFRPSWIPVLGRTAAGIVHFWNQASLPEPQQAVTELDELVKKHIGRAIISSADGTISIDLQARPLLDTFKSQQVNLIRVSGYSDEQIVEFIECADIHRLYPDSFALHIDGDSMSPRINDGDIVILSPSVPAAQGQIGIARVADQIGVTCKLIRSTEQNVHLIPINERYPTKVVAEKDLLWALAVLCHISLQ